jgi:hypothetical protein
MKGSSMRSVLLASLVSIVAVTACQRTAPAPAATTAAPGAVTAAAPGAATAAGAVTAPKAAAKVAKIVFLDKEHACDCTRKRTAETWAAMQAALGTPSRLPVERIHVDTQEARAQPYTAAKPLMVPPGLYFVDGSSAVVAMLQGEVTTAQVAAVLAGR